MRVTTYKYVVQEERQRVAALHEASMLITSLTNTHYKWHSLLHLLSFTRIAFLVIFIVYIPSLFIFNFVAASMVEVKTGDSLDL